MNRNGSAAEELIFNKITTDASNDIEQATKIAKSMVTRFGMHDKFDMVAMESVNNQYLGGDSTLSCSAETQTLVDEEVRKIIKKQHQKAHQILEENIGKLHELSKFLYEHCSVAVKLQKGCE